MQLSGVDMVHIPYKGAGSLMPHLLAGTVDLSFPNLPSGLQLAEQGLLRALGVTTKTRSGAAPSIPSIAEAGVPGYEITPWGGYAVPAGTPKPIVMRLNAELNKIVAMPNVRERWIAVGIEPIGGTPEHFTTHVKKETAKWSEVIKRMQAKPAD